MPEVTPALINPGGTFSTPAHPTAQAGSIAQTPAGAMFDGLLPTSSADWPDSLPDTLRLAAEIDRTGYAVLEHYLAPDMLEQGRAFVTQALAQHQGEYFALHGIEALSGSLPANLALSAALKEMLSELYTRQTGRAPSPEEQVFPVIRCLQGKSGLKQSHFYHFDATAVTALLPLFIPSEGEHCGDLILFPNLRPVRFNALCNVIEKAVLHNTFSQKMVALAVRRGWLQPIRLKLEPGNLYLFWGYRSLHANDECDPALLRATALLHFGNPHHDSWLARLLLGNNKRRAKLDHNGLRSAG